MTHARPETAKTTADRFVCMCLPFAEMHMALLNELILTGLFRLYTFRAYGAGLCFPNFSWRDLHGCHCVACIDNTSRPIGELLIVHTSVVRCNQHQIKTRYIPGVPVHRFFPCKACMLTRGLYHRHIRIMVFHLRPAFA